MSNIFAPIPPRQFDREAARHLLRRLGYAAVPTEVDEALKHGPLATVRAAFAGDRPMPVPQDINDFDDEAPALKEKAKGLSAEERKALFDDIRRKARAAYTDYTLRWFDFAARSENGPQEKAVAWLQNIFVIGAQKVKNPGTLFDYQSMLRRGLYGDYPSLLKQVMHHPGMIRYLDLSQNSAGAPNENFARELFELFTLGEGQYEERDIKEAARALSGILLRGGVYHFEPKRHDPGVKTIFGQTGNWKPDDVLRITVDRGRFPTFVANDFIRTYVTTGPLPPGCAEELGRIWQASGYRILTLHETVFNSAFFYAPQYRASLIKSPHEYYLGLCRDLRLSPAPYAGALLPALRVMGQTFFDPPNVRGWVGDKTWINASTLGARRQLVAGLFRAPDETKLNADDRAALERAREEGRGPFWVDPERLDSFAMENSPEKLARALCERLLARPPTPEFHNSLVNVLTETAPTDSRMRRDTIVALLQSPAYQLA